MIKLKSILLEYITNPISELIRYLTIPENDKRIQLALENDCLSYLKLNYPKLYKKYKSVEYGESSSLLKQEFPDIFDRWSQFVYDNISTLRPGYPTWQYMDYEKLLKNQWMIHFTNVNNATDIWKSQSFKYGVYDYTQLGLTQFIPKKLKNDKGYNFAYLPGDVEKYGHTKNSKQYKYGNSAVLFKASGIYVNHFTDAEYQVIFWGPTAHDIMQLHQNNSDEWFIINSKISKPIFKGTLLQCINWVNVNFDQYKKILLP